MDASVPKGAALLLDFIAMPESGGRYDIVYGDHEEALPKPITEMTVTEVLAAQKLLKKRFGNSAVGRYQAIPGTLQGLITALRLNGRELFSPDLQDRMGYRLLVQRGYARFMARQITTVAFARSLAQEWASLPVLADTQGAHRRIAAGETYYAGDRLNKALVTPRELDGVLARVHACEA